MSFYDLIKETLRSISANKLRSGLTILGIIIGIAAVISMISIGEGTKKQISQSIEGLGSNILSIVPGASRMGIIALGRGTAQSLKEDDLKILQTVRGVIYAVPLIQRNFQIIAPNGKNTRTMVIGSDENLFIVREIELLDGTNFTEEDVRNMTKVAVIGKNIVEDLFEDKNPIGQKIKINGVNFKVIGITAPKGGSFGFILDDLVFIPYTTMQKILLKSEYLSAILVKVQDKNLIEQVREEIIQVLSRKHRVDPQDPDFSVISQEEIVSTLNQVINTMTIFLASIAAISLIVGGIGIMNMMLTSVTERTKEIGLRKAIGAKKREILLQFLIESIVLTLIGGIFGIILGSLISIGVSRFANITSEVSLFSIFLSLTFSTLVGIIFGYWPAKRAADLDPIVALRYE